MINGSRGIGRESPGLPVCDNSIDGKAVMPQEFPQTINGRSFHFEVGDNVHPAPEGRELTDQVGVGQR